MENEKDFIEDTNLIDKCGAPDKKVFEGFGPEQWFKYYESLNAEIPVEQCTLELTDSEKECYVKALAFLKQERKDIPGVKYEVNYRDLE